MRHITTALAALASLAAFGLPVAADTADPVPDVDTGCTAIQCEEDRDLDIGVTAPGSESGDGGVGVSDPGASGAGRERVCTSGGREIDCDGGRFGVWNGTCYVTIPDPQPPKDDQAWEGREDGVIVVCMPYVCVPQPGQVRIPEEDCPGRQEYWAPADPTPDVDAVQLAERAVDQMQLSAVEIGIVPDDEPGKIGYIGAPAWMWVRDPGPSTTGPNEASASAGGYTVTARAVLDRIEWDMGNDDDVVTCEGPGTPYEDRFGVRHSPDCGYVFDEQGDYTVTARSFWTVAWEGVGQSGTIPIELERSTQIQVGELQVLTR